MPEQARGARAGAVAVGIGQRGLAGLARLNSQPFPYPSSRPSRLPPSLLPANPDSPSQTASQPASHWWPLTTVMTFLPGNCWLPFSMRSPGVVVQPRPSAAAAQRGQFTADRRAGSRQAAGGRLWPPTLAGTPALLLNCAAAPGVKDTLKSFPMRKAACLPAHTQPGPPHVTHRHCGAGRHWSSQSHTQP